MGDKRGLRACTRCVPLGLLTCLLITSVESTLGPYSKLGNRIYTFGTIQMDPLYSQYGEGFIRNLTESVAANLGLNHRLVSYSGNITGAWDNLVHTVANGEIDVGATLLTKTRCRQELVSFTAPFLTSTLSALYHGNRGVVRKPKELLTSGFILGTLNHSAVTDVMADSTDTTVQEILSTVMSDDGNLVHTVQEGVNRVRHSNFILIIDTVIAKYIAAQRPCELKTLKLSGERFEYGFIVRKGASLLAALSDAILDLDKKEELQELVKKLIYDKKECGKIR